VNPLLVAVVVLPALVVGFGAGPAITVTLTAVGVRRLVISRRTKQERLAASANLAEVAELFELAASAGHPVASALEVVALRAPVPFDRYISEAVASLHHGLAMNEVLDALALRLAPIGSELIGALNRSAATGVALEPLLVEVADLYRDQRLRDAQGAARKLPVTMLLPLTMCTLPAAVLLAVVPVVAVALSAVAL